MAHTHEGTSVQATPGRMLPRAHRAKAVLIGTTISGARHNARPRPHSHQIIDMAGAMTHVTVEKECLAANTSSVSQLATRWCNYDRRRSQLRCTPIFAQQTDLSAVSLSRGS
eukprot:COSAG02_NODE_3074_length_7423_cov_1.966548_2_plen_112_part_00